MSPRTTDHSGRPADLTGRVCIVAGATRGAGRGIAAALGEVGATVVCTGRSSSSSSSGGPSSDYVGRTETVEETAALVTSLGGVGIAEVVDHLDPDAVAALAGRVRSDHGHLDVLVNDIWGGEELKEWDVPVWEHDLANGLRMLRLAIDTHLITAHHLLPLLLARPGGGGLHVEVTDGTAAYNATRYRLCAYYDLCKVAINRLAFSLGHELGAVGATAVGLTPGWLRSEMMLEHFATTEGAWQDAVAAGTAPPDFALSESPRFVGRAVVALACDPERGRWNQESVHSGQLAQVYGFTDVDGSRPDVWRFIEDVRERGLDADYADFR